MGKYHRRQQSLSLMVPFAEPLVLQFDVNGEICTNNWMVWLVVFRVQVSNDIHANILIKGE